MKINTYEAMASMLEMQQFKFNAINNNHKESNLLMISNCLASCNTVNLEDKLYYKARRIYANSEGIKFCDGIPQNGFDSKNSGVAPSNKCKFGRANDNKEQVLYISDDIETTIKEVRTPKDEYVSIASCQFNTSVTVFDFSPYSEIQLKEYIDNSCLSGSIDGRSLCLIFMEIQRILTLPEYSENDYIISRDLVRIIKNKYSNVSGMLYCSHFTGKKNIAIWDDNKYVIFSDGKLVYNRN